MLIFLFYLSNNSLFTIKLLVVQLTNFGAFSSVALNYAKQLPFCILITSGIKKKQQADTLAKMQGEKKRPNCVFPTSFLFFFFFFLQFKRTSHTSKWGEKKTHGSPWFLTGMHMYLCVCGGVGGGAGLKDERTGELKENWLCKRRTSAE